MTLLGKVLEKTARRKSMEVWNNAIEQAVRELGNKFDSHRVIKKIAHHNQRRYASALAQIDSDTPFQSLHSKLGRQIKVVCEGLGFNGVESRSLDMFDQNSKCMEWSK